MSSAEEFLNQLLDKINQITSSLDGTIAQIENMTNMVTGMSQKFSEETVSLTENIRLIVQVLKQFRVQSNKSIQDLSDEFNDKIKELYEKKIVEAILEDEKEAIKIIKTAQKAVEENLYFAQLLTIIQSIREETNRVLASQK